MSKVSFCSEIHKIFLTKLDTAKILRDYFFCSFIRARQTLATESSSQIPLDFVENR